jgi:site-specific recombinase XerD
MSREHKKKWNFITEITKKWVKTFYPNASVQTAWKYKDRMNRFFKFLDVTDAEFIEAYKRTEDRHEWAKRMGLKVIAFYNDRVSKGYATNTVRAEVSTVRAFCRDNCTTLLIPRRKIAKAKAAKGEHEFTREELSKMFYVADVRGKAILSTAISLGFSVKDFSQLKRDFVESLVNNALREKRDFMPFDYERGKTGVQSRSHLTPEAINSLKAWFEYVDQYRAEKGLPKSEWVWANGNSGHLDPQTLNDIVKDLVTKANITTTGNVRFHLLRKFLMNAIQDAGFDSWETKRVLGKEIPTSDSTYLQGLSRKVTEKFPKAYDFIRLTGFESNNHTRIEDLEAKLQQMEIRQEQMEMENKALRRILEFAIPPETIKKALIETAKRLPNMTKEKLGQLENSLKMVRTEEDIEHVLQNYMGQIKRIKEDKQ